MQLIAFRPAGPDPAVIVIGLVLMLWIARLAFSYFAERKWQWTIADLLWLMFFAGLATTYLLLLR